MKHHLSAVLVGFAVLAVISMALFSVMFLAGELVLVVAFVVFTLVVVSWLIGEVVLLAILKDQR